MMYIIFKNKMYFIHKLSIEQFLSFTKVFHKKGNKTLFDQPINILFERACIKLTFQI